jgi:DNA-binding NtrC family response regulator
MSGVRGGPGAAGAVGESEPRPVCSSLSFVWRPRDDARAMPGRVLIVDDDPAFAGFVAEVLDEAGIEHELAATGAEAMRRMEDEPAAVVLDLMLPDADGIELLERFKAQWPSVPVVVLTGHGAVAEAVECMRRGASDFAQKPVQPARLATAVKNAITQSRLRTRVESLARDLRGRHGFDSILGRSPALLSAIKLLRRAAQSDVSVLLQGESGTGKEVAAHAVHAEGTVREGPFVAINCGAIPENLIESELFGHEKGAFTGAHAAHKGVFETADGGTLFLDEIGELRPDLQVRLLRVLQDRTVTRLGGTTPRRVAVRVIAATNRDLEADVAARRFREDVYYRLAVFPVRLPPLRERGGDVPLLAEAFLGRERERRRGTATGFTDDAMSALCRHPWPGNVRELENAVERAVILEDGPRISLSSLPDAVVCAVEPAPGPAPAQAETAVDRPVATASAGDATTLEEMERRAVVRALEATEGNVQAAATLLGISRATIYRKAERYGLHFPAR